jgi:hypothetical protein
VARRLLRTREIEQVRARLRILRRSDRLVGARMPAGRLTTVLSREAPYPPALRIGCGCEWSSSLVVPDGVGTHRATLRRCQQAHPVVATGARELLQMTTVGFGRRRRLRFALEFERQRVQSFPRRYIPRGDWAQPQSPAERLCRAMSCACLEGVRSVVRASLSLLLRPTVGRPLSADRFLALLSRTLFALLRMPRVPEGASAIYGAGPESWPQGQCDPHYTEARDLCCDHPRQRGHTVKRAQILSTRLWPAPR